MNNFKKPNLGSLEANYKTLVTQIDHLIEEENDITAILSNVSSALQETFNFLWVGFYAGTDYEVRENYLYPQAGGNYMFSLNVKI